jgi:hypothetical protein
MISIQEYLSEENESPFRQWFDGLDPQAAAIVTTAIGRLGDGNTSNVKSIGEGASELRIDRGPGYRQSAGDPSGRRHQAKATERYRSGVAAVARLQAAQGRRQEGLTCH